MGDTNQTPEAISQSSVLKLRRGLEDIDLLLDAASAMAERGDGDACGAVLMATRYYLHNLQGELAPLWGEA